MLFKMQYSIIVYTTTFFTIFVYTNFRTDLTAILLFESCIVVGIDKNTTKTYFSNLKNVKWTKTVIV